VNDNPAAGVAFTRPLCVFPNIARCKGAGNTADAANWICVRGPANATTEAAAAAITIATRASAVIGMTAE
jgi:hypothetical protein